MYNSVMLRTLTRSKLNDSLKLEYGLVRVKKFGVGVQDSTALQIQGK